MRGGRYRFQMIEEEKMRLWAPHLEPVFQDWRRLEQQGLLEPWELVAHYLLLFVFLNRPAEKWNQHDLLTRGRSENPSQLTAGVLEGLKNILPESKLAQWGRCSSWVYGGMTALRGVPDKVLLSLRGWRDQQYDLRLMYIVPSAQDLLRIQSQGQRCVSVLIQAQEIKGPVETGRDVWSFCLHDLLHASHFFGEPQYFNSQRYLSWFFLHIWEHSVLGEWLQEDPEFAREFTYVAADMNAHPVYILYSFYAKVLSFYKRRRGYPENRSLLPEEEILWRAFWCDWVARTIQEETMREVLMLLPEPDLHRTHMARVEGALLASGEVYAGGTMFMEQY